MIDIYGTLGPSCSDERTLEKMFAEGMTGIRINLSHVALCDCIEKISMIHSAADKCKASPKILIDMQGPELRIGRVESPIALNEGDTVDLCKDGVELSDNSGMGILKNRRIVIPEEVLPHLKPEMEVLLDDGKILVTVESVHATYAEAKVRRGGILTSRKSIALKDAKLDLPAMTREDVANIKTAKDLGIYGVMQPFVRSREDLLEVRRILDENGCSDFKIFAKIENKDGMENISSFMDACDEIIIARGDLGNSMPLWELPRAQKRIAKQCRDWGKSFMVVTQMLSSMEHSKVPTRAEVSDIYNAFLDGASSVMVTGETAVGEYPVEVIRYLKKTAEEALKSI
ncbi:MAG: pyruvate kinase [Lachnospiraceae bacterium]|nr:pyruvate kinase [Lachnospiraceae bacterium]